MKPLSAGRLRHRINIEEQIEEQDSESGAITVSWQLVDVGEDTEWSDIPAEIVPVTAREFVAANAQQSQIVAKITIRHRPGVTAKMRAVHQGTYYNIQGVLPDENSGREYLLLPCSAGTSKG